jgi:hypothetical protein
MTTTRREILTGGLLLASTGLAKLARAGTIAPSPGWTGAMPSAPVSQTKITEQYARMIATDAYFWGWPLANVYNRRLIYAKVPDIVMAGPVPAAPLNRLGMLTNYIVPEERIVACPNPSNRTFCRGRQSYPCAGRRGCGLRRRRTRARSTGSIRSPFQSGPTSK